MGHAFSSGAWRKLSTYIFLSITHLESKLNSGNFLCFQNGDLRIRAGRVVAEGWGLASMATPLPQGQPDGGKGILSTLQPAHA